MAAVGRGRGRGRGLLNLKEPKPGKVSEGGDDEISDLSALLESLEVSPNKDSISSFVELAHKAATSEQKLIDVFNVLYNKCLVNWRLSKMSGRLCQELSTLQTDGVKFREILLRSIQKDFKNKDNLRQESPEKCLGCLSFLCQSFVCLRGADERPFAPLISPVLESIEFLLDNKASDTEMEGACVQLLAVGTIIARYDNVKRLSKFRMLLRDKILDNCGSRNTRLLMVDLLETIASNWTYNVTT